MARTSRPDHIPKAPNPRASQIRQTHGAFGRADVDVASAVMCFVADPVVVFSAERDPGREVVDLVIEDANAAAMDLLGLSRETLPVSAAERIFVTGPTELPGLVGRAAGASPITLPVVVGRGDGALPAAMVCLASGGGFIAVLRTPGAAQDPAASGDVGRLAARLAHEFNNVLQTVRSATDAISLDRGGARGDLDAINIAVVRMAAMTRQLQTFTRQQVRQPVEVELSAWLAALAWMLRGLVGDVARFEAAPGHSALRVRVDPAQLELAVINLVENAREAIGDAGVGTSVCVQLEPVSVRDHATLAAGDYARLSVIDDGRGIASEHLRFIFEPGFTTKDSLRGTGLGLANVRRVVLEAGGAVEVISEGGAGARFDLYLPLADAQRPSQPTPPVEVSTRASGAVRVLIVDDEPAIVRGAARLLLRLGYLVHVAGSAAEALELLSGADQFDVLLTDYAMPGSSGADLLQVVRAEWPSIATILMSGHTADPTARAELLRSETVFLAKPFSLDDLQRAVERVLAVRPRAAERR